MNVETKVEVRGPLDPSSNRILLDNDKANALRPQSEQKEHVPSLDKRGWSYFIQSKLILQTYQKRLIFNSDLKVATLEFLIMLLSILQLQCSYKSSHWRQQRACAMRPRCINTLTDVSFAIPNVIQILLGFLGLIRLLIRWNQLWRMKRHKRPTVRNKAERVLQFLLELAYTVIFPYPGLETFIPGSHGDAFVALSLSVFLRTISWAQWLYYPYPIRQKEKVASFSGNLEFSYRQFVIKKVMDDTPIVKFFTFYTVLGIAVAYLLHVVETIKGQCSWEQSELEIVRSGDAVCYELSLSNSLWIVAMTFFSFEFGDVSIRSGRSQTLMLITAFIAMMLDATLFSIVTKKFAFSTMEARVHSFFHRMKLKNKKEISAVMAVQATFRYSKSYKSSHRLPNELKKNLYASHFQQSLKQILKNNMDSDPLNTFSKHVEVITAALGATFGDVVRLKRMYFHRVRALEQRKRQASQRGSLPLNERSTLFLSNAEQPKPILHTPSRSHDQSAIIDLSPTASIGKSATAWEDEMQRKCEVTMRLLKQMEANISAIHRT